MKFLVINGPNLNLLGIREPDIYGKEDYAALTELIRQTCQSEQIDVEIWQSNHEGAIVDKIQQCYGQKDGLIINPAAYTHTSVAIPDAIKAVGLPAVEVHISDISTREAFRAHSYTSAACIATLKGEGLAGYAHAIRLLKAHLPHS